MKTSRPFFVSIIAILTLLGAVGIFFLLSSNNVKATSVSSASTKFGVNNAVTDKVSVGDKSVIVCRAVPKLLPQIAFNYRRLDARPNLTDETIEGWLSSVPEKVYPTDNNMDDPKAKSMHELGECFKQNNVPKGGALSLGFWYFIDAAGKATPTKIQIEGSNVPPEYDGVIEKCLSKHHQKYTQKFDSGLYGEAVAMTVLPTEMGRHWYFAQLAKGK